MPFNLVWTVFDLILTYYYGILVHFCSIQLSSTYATVIISCLPFEYIVVLGDLLELETSYYMTVCFLQCFCTRVTEACSTIITNHDAQGTSIFPLMALSIENITHFLHETEREQSSAGGSFDYVDHQSEYEPFSSLLSLFSASEV